MLGVSKLCDELRGPYFEEVAGDALIATSKIGAFGVLVAATYRPEPFMPTTVRIAPEMPSATYQLRREGLARLPILRSIVSQRGIQMDGDGGEARRRAAS